MLGAVLRTQRKINSVVATDELLPHWGCPERPDRSRNGKVGLHVALCGHGSSCHLGWSEFLSFGCKTRQSNFWLPVSFLSPVSKCPQQGL